MEIGMSQMPVLRFGWRWPMRLHSCSSGVLQGLPARISCTSPI